MPMIEVPEDATEEEIRELVLGSQKWFEVELNSGEVFETIRIKKSTWSLAEDVVNWIKLYRPRIESITEVKDV